jgi:hypothetical protein
VKRGHNFQDEEVDVKILTAVKLITNSTEKKGWICEHQSKVTTPCSLSLWELPLRRAKWHQSIYYK